MRRLITLFQALVLAFLGACGSVQTVELNTVYSGGTAYLAADTLAKQYMNLPACMPGGSPVCSVPAVVTRIKSLDNQIYNDYQIAETTAKAGATPNTPALQSAIQQLSVLVGQIKGILPPATPK